MELLLEDASEDLLPEELLPKRFIIFAYNFLKNFGSRKFLSTKLHKIKATTHRDAYRSYQAFKLLRTLRIQHASSSTATPRVANYSKYKPLKQKLIGQTVESHTKQ